MLAFRSSAAALSYGVTGVRAPDHPDLARACPTQSLALGALKDRFELGAVDQVDSNDLNRNAMRIAQFGR